MHHDFEPVIGLEIHAQLNTKSKLFSTAANRFGDEPNINITEVCTGQPGSLPVLNKEAVAKAVAFGCAVNATVSLSSRFDRKSYFYPDSPRNFQITQLDEPIIRGGWIETEVDREKKRFAINRAHLEDDAGMLKHFSNFAGVDYNRAGVPLIEIVSEPCIHSPKEAVAYAMAIRAILLYLDASDCNMEEGSLRVDCNISVRRKGETSLRNKIEIKNLNSFYYMQTALETEIYRQIKLYQAHPHEDPKKVLKSGTYRFDPDKKETILMRQKEAADDYRYFPEPDLPPIVLSESYIETIRKNLPELPSARLRRYLEELKLIEDNALFLAQNKKLSDYFEEGLKTAFYPKQLSNWMLVEFAGRLKELGKSLEESHIPSSHIAKLVMLIEKGVITGKIAKSIADEMVASPGKDPEEIVKNNPDYQPLNDTSKIEAMVLEVLHQNPESIRDFKAGKTKAFAFLVGQVMKLCRGTASPEIVNTLIHQHIQNL